MNLRTVSAAADNHEVRIKNRVAEIRRALSSEEARRAHDSSHECRDAMERLARVADRVEASIASVPPIDVVVLGPSRHGKSTLLNALAECEVLPTSDIKPCTAAIVKLKYADEWSVAVRFVDRDQLVNDWRDAVADAREALDGLNDQGDEPAGNRHIKSLLQRFIGLFGIDSQLPPEELVHAVSSAEIPGEIARWLGRSAKPTDIDQVGLGKAVEKYLSTSDVLWTIVASCEISGPFEGWHKSLSLVDLPGTNDTDPQRTQVTNSMRENATAVAIVTSDSNLGSDIESWLRNSSVLANFLESTSKRRQRLFIIRTKLDSYHPPIDETQLEGLSEQEETQVHLDAVEAYQRDQAATYHEMLRDIADPKLPHGETEEARRTRSELLSRLDGIRVFFVSALAHEVFCDRYRATRKTRRNLTEYFDGDLDATGVPQLKKFLNDIAHQYLSDNFYEDLESDLESEVRLLASTFQTTLSAMQAEIAGGRESLQKIAENVDTQILPWLQLEIQSRTDAFQELTLSGTNGLRDRLSQVEAMSERRFADKIRIWSGLHWASLRSTARKAGVHTTSRGVLIDLNEDICSVLIDDVSLAWVQFRDYLIADQVTMMTSELAEKLTLRLNQLKEGHNIPEVAEAVECLANHLLSITHQQRGQLLEAVNGKIKQVESLRKPAYKIAQEEMAEVLHGICDERGAGCAHRMRMTLEEHAPEAIKRIRDRVNKLIDEALSDLNSTCGTALRQFAQSMTSEIRNAISEVTDSVEERDRVVLEGQVKVLNSAIKRLPGPTIGA